MLTRKICGMTKYPKWAERLDPCCYCAGTKGVRWSSIVGMIRGRESVLPAWLCSECREGS